MPGPAPLVDAPGSPPGFAPGDEAAVSEILEVVHARCGTPFQGYRRATVVRRIRNRMISAGVPTLPAYAAFLREDPAEPARLLERLTVKVSRLWRNADHVASLSRALASAGPGALRAWSAGCAQGEEAYTLGALLEAVAGRAPWSVLGTDVDPGALAAARRGRYGPAALVEVPAEIARRHLSPPDQDGWRAVGSALRGGVTFAEHDLVSADAPPPPGAYALVACRNVLIYFLPASQAEVLSRVVDRLAPGGWLLLGEAEWPAPAVERRLEIVDRAHRLFRRRAGEGRP